MPVDLINIDNIVLANDIETWFERTNEIIDALNPLQLYDFYDNFYTTGDGVAPTIPGFTTLSDLTEATTLGLKITRDIRFDGDMLIEIIPEAPLGFNSTTGRLALNFTGPLVPVLGTDCLIPNRVENDDRYIVHDTSSTTTKVVEASNMLPPVLNCDHAFGTAPTGPGSVTITIKGNLIVDGTQTILSTVNVSSEDRNIDLNDDGTGTGTAAGNDSIADGGGITLLSTDGNKTFSWSDAGDRWIVNQGFEVNPAFSLFTTTIEPQLNVLDLLGAGGPVAVSLRFLEIGGPPAEEWKFNLQVFGAGQSRFVVGNYPSNVNPLVGAPDGTFELEHVGAPFPLTIVFDSSTTTNDPGIRGFAERLNADMLDGCHADQVPTPFFIPCADATGQIDKGWVPNTGSVIKEINQTGHGLVKGNIVRPDPSNPDEYILAQADNLANAESVGMVSLVIDVDNFELTLIGCVFNVDGAASHVKDHSAAPLPGGALVPGQAYFLSTGKAGSFTETPVLGGEIQKTVLVATSTTDVIIMNYVGGQTDPTAGTFAAVFSNDLTGAGAFVAGQLDLPATIVERTSVQATSLVPGLLPLAVEDSTGAGFRTFEITLNSTTTLELQEPSAVGWNLITTPDFHTNSVTLLITQATGGGHTPNITISGVGTIIWDNSATQPPAAAAVGKTTVYVLINSTNNPGVWYGSRAVFEL